MSASSTSVPASDAAAPTRSITTDGVSYAYRELGPKGGVPVVFFHHLGANLDNWDPRIIDPIAQEHHVVTFDNRGLGASTGAVPDSIEAMADDAATFIRALGFEEVDVFGFSLGGMVAQELVGKHPGLVRKLILAGTGPRGGRGMDKVARVTYLDVLRAALVRADPKEFLFFIRNAAGKQAARAFIDGASLFMISAGVATFSELLGRQLSGAATKGGFKTSLHRFMRTIEDGIKHNNKARRVLEKGDALASDAELESLRRDFYDAIRSRADALTPIALTDGVSLREVITGALP